LNGLRGKSHETGFLRLRLSKMGSDSILKGKAAS
jgi:hypothetical protein